MGVACAWGCTRGMCTPVLLELLGAACTREWRLFLPALLAVGHQFDSGEYSRAASDRASTVHVHVYTIHNNKSLLMSATDYSQL